MRGISIVKAAGSKEKIDPGVLCCCEPAGWGDACVLVPIAMYEQAGNTEVLKGQDQTMKRWCGFIIRCAASYRGDRRLPREIDRYLWNTGFHYGEWLIPGRTINGLSDSVSIASAVMEGKKYIPEMYGCLAMKSFARVFELLGENENAAYDSAMAEKLRSSFVQEILRLIEENNGCLDTGFPAIPFIPDTLCENSCVKNACDLLFIDKCPSWLNEAGHAD